MQARGLHIVSVYAQGMREQDRIKRIRSFFNGFAKTQGSEKADIWSTYYDVRFHANGQHVLKDHLPFLKKSGMDMLVVLADDVCEKTIVNIQSSLDVPVVLLLSTPQIPKGLWQKIQDSRIHPMVLSHQTSMHAMIKQFLRIAMFEAMRAHDTEHLMTLIKQLAHAQFWLEGDLELVHDGEQNIARLNLGQWIVKQYLLGNKQAMSHSADDFLCLHLSARLGLPNVTRFLMQKSIMEQEQLPMIGGNNPLHAAVLSKQYSVIKAMMGQKEWLAIWAEMRNDYGLNPLELAALTWPQNLVSDKQIFALIKLCCDPGESPWQKMMSISIESMRDVLLSRFLLAPYNAHWREDFWQSLGPKERAMFGSSACFAALR